MKLLESKKGIHLPDIVFVTDKNDIKGIPLLVPYIYAPASAEDNIVRILEYKVLYESLMKSGLEFDFKKLLRMAGFDDLIDWAYNNPSLQDYFTDPESMIKVNVVADNEVIEREESFDDMIKDENVYVDMETLLYLQIMPSFVARIEENISQSLNTYFDFNAEAYNKKMNLCSGIFQENIVKKNLFVIDVSASIPKGVTAMTLSFVSHLATKFYADVLITGGKSHLFPLETLDGKTADDLFKDNYFGNEAEMFRALVTGDVRTYGTCIVFGDNHSPCDAWGGCKSISRDDAKKICTWTVDHLICFHTDNDDTVPGYADFFDYKTKEHISDWVDYIK
jgi:hypothetical protein